MTLTPLSTVTGLLVGDTARSEFIEEIVLELGQGFRNVITVVSGFRVRQTSTVIIQRLQSSLVCLLAAASESASIQVINQSEVTDIQAQGDGLTDSIDSIAGTSARN